MATILPFRAVRPAGNLAKEVSTRSFETYSPREMEAVLNSNPYSFLQILNPGHNSGMKLFGKNRYRGIRGRYTDFLEKGVMRRDERACIYLYQIEKDGESYLGIFCVTSTEEYRQGVIKRHEATLESREQLFARYLEEVRFNAEPVLMMYPDQYEISAIMEHESQREPLYDFFTEDGYRHRLWDIGLPATLNRLRELFGQQESLYIADGHHRSASSNRMALQATAGNPLHTGMEGYNFFLSYLLPESAIRVSQYTRLIRDLNGHGISEFLDLLRQQFHVEATGQHPWQPNGKHEFCMYLGNTFFALRLKAEIWPFSDVLGKLDPYILYTSVLKPLLGVEDLRNDQRIAYGSGRDRMEQMKARIDAGDFAVGFGMVPLSIREIKSIANKGLVMPPKSTYIEPKLRSGLIIYEF